MSQRLLRVQELLKRELGTILQRDYDFAGVIVTVREVDIAPNLRNATAYVSILGGKGSEGRVIEKLNKNNGNIQRQMTKRVVLKYTPQLRFVLDDSIARGVKTLEVIQEIEPTIPDDEEEE